jgi:hypothetical protein
VVSEPRNKDYVTFKEDSAPRNANEKETPMSQQYFYSNAKSEQFSNELMRTYKPVDSN